MTFTSTLVRLRKLMGVWLNRLTVIQKHAWVARINAVFDRKKQYHRLLRNLVTKHSPFQQRQKIMHRSTARLEMMAGSREQIKLVSYHSPVRSSLVLVFYEETTFTDTKCTNVS